MADIFTEIEEGLRQETLASAFQRYVPYLIGVALIILATVGALDYSRYAKQKSSEAKTAKLEAGLKAFSANDYEAASKTLTSIADSKAPLAPVAAQYLAQTRIEGNGDKQAAAKILASAATKGSGPTEKLALLKAAYLESERLSRIDLQAMLGDLPQESSAYGSLALELLAAKSLEEGDYNYARKQFTLLKVRPDVPEGVKERAEQALAIMPPPAPEAPEK